MATQAPPDARVRPKARGRSRKGWLANLALALVSAAIPVVVFLLLREALFFDRFFYQKSPAHGYGLNLPLEAFGERAADLLRLRSFIGRRGAPARGAAPVAAEGDDETYTIAVIGDSFVWGQGVRERHRFAVLLEQMLDRIAPTRVLSFGDSGDGVYDNYLKYLWVQRMEPDVDLWIFGIVSNDLFLNRPERYDPELFQQMLPDCGGKPFYYDVPMDRVDPAVPYGEHIRRSYDTERYGNYCLLEELAAHRLPRERALYFDFGKPYRDAEGERYAATLREHGLHVLDASPAFVEVYGAEAVDARNHPDFVVSRHDCHPSKHANAIFADVLFRAITGDPRYAFPLRATASAPRRPGT